VRFTDAGLPGAWLLELEPIEDERGFFARTFSEEEFAAHGLVARYPQGNLSWNRRRGTLRGMHYQAAPYREAKLVRCVRGAIHDVIVDLRPGSSSRCRWIGVDLDAEGRSALYVPPGFAHGFVTLRDDTEVVYQMGEVYVAGAARGVRWNDPAFDIRWPLEPVVISERDRGYPDYDPSRFDG
jgi:dTDP-4-dehydrorhamnose 3,5-epimerase